MSETAAMIDCVPVRHEGVKRGREIASEGEEEAAAFSIRRTIAPTVASRVSTTTPPAAVPADSALAKVLRPFLFVWDEENAQIPREYKSAADRFIARIKKWLALHFRTPVTDFRIYFDRHDNNISATNLNLLEHDPGVQIVDTPHLNPATGLTQKQAADTKIIADVRGWGATHKDEDAIVCLMSGDGDFVPLLRTLQVEAPRVHTMVVTGHRNVTDAALPLAAKESANLHNDILGQRRLAPTIADIIRSRIESQQRYPFLFGF